MPILNLVCRDAIAKFLSQTIWMSIRLKRRDFGADSVFRYSVPTNIHLYWK
jgi:hypothetical protein